MSGLVFPQRGQCFVCTFSSMVAVASPTPCREMRFPEEQDQAQPRTREARQQVSSPLQILQLFNANVSQMIYPDYCTDYNYDCNQAHYRLDSRGAGEVLS
jgi:hypothetical protein